MTTGPPVKEKRGGDLAATTPKLQLLIDDTPIVCGAQAVEGFGIRRDGRRAVHPFSRRRELFFTSSAQLRAQRLATLLARSCARLRQLIGANERRGY